MENYHYTNDFTIFKADDDFEDVEATVERPLAPSDATMLLNFDAMEGSGASTAAVPTDKGCCCALALRTFLGTFEVLPGDDFASMTLLPERVWTKWGIGLADARNEGDHVKTSSGGDSPPRDLFCSDVAGLKL